MLISFLCRCRYKIFRTDGTLCFFNGSNSIMANSIIYEDFFHDGISCIFIEYYSRLSSKDFCFIPSLLIFSNYVGYTNSQHTSPTSAQGCMPPPQGLDKSLYIYIYIIYTYSLLARPCGFGSMKCGGKTRLHVGEPGSS